MRSSIQNEDKSTYVARFSMATVHTCNKNNLHPPSVLEIVKTKRKSYTVDRYLLPIVTSRREKSAMIMLRTIVPVLTIVVATTTNFGLAFTPSTRSYVRSVTPALQMGLDTQEFMVGILGDLHIDPRKMEDYIIGREQWIPIFEEAKAKHGNVALVSLGDLGESKNCDHNPSNPSELFAGTTICHEMAAEYLSSFNVPYEVVGGNHGTSPILGSCWCWCYRYISKNG